MPHATGHHVVRSLAAVRARCSSCAATRRRCASCQGNRLRVQERASLLCEQHEPHGGRHAVTGRRIQGHHRRMTYDGHHAVTHLDRQVRSRVGRDRARDDLQTRGLQHIGQHLAQACRSGADDHAVDQIVAPCLLGATAEHECARRGHQGALVDQHGAYGLNASGSILDTSHAPIKVPPTMAPAAATPYDAGVRRSRAAAPTNTNVTPTAGCSTMPRAIGTDSAATAQRHPTSFPNGVVSRTSNRHAWCATSSHADNDPDHQLTAARTRRSLGAKGPRIARPAVARKSPTSGTSHLCAGGDPTWVSAQPAHAASAMQQAAASQLSNRIRGADQAIPSWSSCAPGMSLRVCRVGSVPSVR